MKKSTHGPYLQQNIPIQTRERRSPRTPEMESTFSFIPQKTTYVSTLTRDSKDVQRLFLCCQVDMLGIIHLIGSLTDACVMHCKLMQLPLRTEAKMPVGSLSLSLVLSLFVNEDVSQLR